MSSSQHEATIWQAHTLVGLCGVAATISHQGALGCRHVGIRSVESNVETFMILAEELKKVSSDYDVRSIRRRFKFACQATLSDSQTDTQSHG
jgi:hypothetical protein